ncbi:flagellar biosynthesis protein FlhA [Vibrio sp. PNB22_3_1]
MLAKINPSKAAIPLVLLAILAMIILPLPPWLLDGLFIFNVSLAILILLKSATTSTVLQFSIFPTLLLVATLLRLTLNVASTRIVLMEGHNGEDAAGKVIQAFGEVVIGGSYVVGIIVFAIIMLINFMVVTKGGERISEVSARFTLDALPGKQMAIDADLNAGLTSQDEAKERRKKVSDEAEFHGAMDGASKFVKGDAIAGLLILVINLVGGILIGVFEHNVDAATAFKTYGLLTIGDGLIAQIPSLLLATASAILVTRINDNDRNIAQTIDAQLTNEAAVLYMGATVMFIIGSIPGMPHFAFYTFAFGLGSLAWFKQRKEVSENTTAQKIAPTTPQTPSVTSLDWSVIPRIDAITLNLGLRLVPFATDKDKQSLVKSILGVRKRLSEKAGFLIPEITIRDDLSLKTNEYAIKIDGDVIETGEVQPSHLLAIGLPPGNTSINGIIGTDPAFNLPALWIESKDKMSAISLGCQVITVDNVIATHVSKVATQNLGKIFNYDDVKASNNRLRQMHPELADSLEAALSTNVQMKIMRRLLEEQAPVVNARLIANTIMENHESTKDAILLTEFVRAKMGRTILNALSPNSKTIPVFMVSDELANKIHEAITNTKSIDPNTPMDSIPLPVELMESLKRNLPVIAQTAAAKNIAPILLTTPVSRPLIAKISRGFAREISVISFTEIPDDFTIETISTI